VGPADGIPVDAEPNESSSSIGADGHGHGKRREVVLKRVEGTTVTDYRCGFFKWKTGVVNKR
jgi:hypothetical protein